MSKTNKKIYILICGQFVETQKKDWLKQLPELTIMTNAEAVEIFDGTSADMTPEVWFKLAKAIYQRLPSASGFVVLHNVDNILYTSSAMTFLLQNLTKPIIFTGRQFNANKIDFKANLINAVQAASNDFSEVALMFGNRLLRASQATLVLPESLNIFSAPDNSVIGRIDFSIRIFRKLVSSNTGRTKLFDKLSDNLAIIDISPLTNLKSLAKQLTDKDGIIVNAENCESLPEDLIFILQKITATVPVVVWSNKMDSLGLTAKNMIVINNMTWVTTELKFAWALTQTTDIKKVLALMTKNIAGEIIT